MANNSKEEELLNRVKNLEETILKWKNWGTTFWTIITVIGVFGISMWGGLVYAYSQVDSKRQIIESEFEELQKKIKEEKRLTNIQFIELNDRVTKQYEQLNGCVVELKKIASQAKSDAEVACNKAGILSQAVYEAKVAAEKSEKALSNAQGVFQQITLKLNMINNISEKQKVSSSGVINLINSDNKKTFFEKHVIEVSSYFSAYIIKEGDFSSDTVFTGYFNRSYIAVPKNSTITIQDVGFCNTFLIPEGMKDKVFFETKANLSTVKHGNYSFL